MTIQELRARQGGLVRLADGKVGQLVPYAAQGAAAVLVQGEPGIRLIPVVRLHEDEKGTLREDSPGGG